MFLSHTLTEIYSHYSTSPVLMSDREITDRTLQNLNDIEVQLAYGYKRFLAKEYDKARIWYQRAEKLEPKNITVLRQYADFCIASGNFASGEEIFREIFRLSPERKLSKEDLAVLHNGLGFCLMAQGETGSAIQRFMESIGTNPDFAVPHFYLARIYYQKSSLNYKKVESYAEDACSLSHIEEPLHTQAQYIWNCAKERISPDSPLLCVH